MRASLFDQRGTGQERRCAALDADESHICVPPPNIAAASTKLPGNQYASVTSRHDNVWGAAGGAIESKEFPRRSN
jgi:hypothetical protein